MALNLSKKDIEEKIKNQIALEFNCLPEDFDKNENEITPACLNEKRRKFSDKPFFLQMATFGKSTVISADDSIHPWLTEWVKGKQGIWLFEQHNYFELECELRKHGYKMALTHHMFISNGLSRRILLLFTEMRISRMQSATSLSPSVLMCFV